jgi:hypothetical protein
VAVGAGAGVEAVVGAGVKNSTYGVKNSTRGTLNPVISSAINFGSSSNGKNRKMSASLLHFLNGDCVVPTTGIDESRARAHLCMRAH